MSNNIESIENTSITISLKMLWTFAVSLLVSSFSLAGFYIATLSKVNDVTSLVRENKTSQTGKDQLQDLQLETLKLTVQKLEIELREYKRSVDK